MNNDVYINDRIEDCRFQKVEGFDVEADSGWSALHVAAEFNAAKIASYLIQTEPGLIGATLTNEQPGGDTPLHVAASCGSHLVAEILLTGGASIDARNCHGAEPLHSAASRYEIRLTERSTNKAIGGVAHMVRHLLNSGADVNASTLDGVTPLFHAVESANEEREYIQIVKLLLQSGANPNHRDSDGDTVLHYLATDSYDWISWELFECILESGADPSATNLAGLSAKALLKKNCTKKSQAEHLKNVLDMLKLS